MVYRKDPLNENEQAQRISEMWDKNTKKRNMSRLRATHENLERRKEILMAHPKAGKMDCPKGYKRAHPKDSRKAHKMVHPKESLKVHTTVSSTALEQEKYVNNALDDVTPAVVNTLGNIP